MTRGKSVQAFQESEFCRMLQHHLRDIHHLANYCSRHGEDPQIVAAWLEDASAQLLELAHSLPAGQTRG